MHLVCRLVFDGFAFGQHLSLGSISAIVVVASTVTENVSEWSMVALFTIVVPAVAVTCAVKETVNRIINSDISCPLDSIRAPIIAGDTA